MQFLVLLEIVDIQGTSSALPCRSGFFDSGICRWR